MLEREAEQQIEKQRAGLEKLDLGEESSDKNSMGEKTSSEDTTSDAAMSEKVSSEDTSGDVDMDAKSETTESVAPSVGTVSQVSFFCAPASPKDHARPCASQQLLTRHRSTRRRRGGARASVHLWLVCLEGPRGHGTVSSR